MCKYNAAGYKMLHTTGYYLDKHPSKFENFEQILYELLANMSFSYKSPLPEIYQQLSQIFLHLR